jgi:hypothetical protein
MRPGPDEGGVVVAVGVGEGVALAAREGEGSGTDVGVGVGKGETLPMLAAEAVKVGVAGGEVADGTGVNEDWSAAGDADNTTPESAWAGPES